MWKIKRIRNPILLFREHLFWKVFGTFFLNFVFLNTIIFYSARYHFETSINERIATEESALVENLVEYWREYYIAHQGWPPKLTAKYYWSVEVRKMLTDAHRSSLFFMLGPMVLQQFSIYDAAHQKISGVVDHRLFDELQFAEPSPRDYSIQTPRPLPANANRILHSSAPKADKEPIPNASQGLTRVADSEPFTVAENPPNDFFANQLFGSSSAFTPENMEYAWYSITVGKNIVGWIHLPRVVRAMQAESRNFFNQSFRSLFQSYVPLVLCITLVFSFYLTRMILKPISILHRGLKALKRKDFDYRAVYHTRDEFGLLTRQFNLMAREMKNFLVQKKMWITSISHEIKTPLTILKGETEAILEGVRPLDMAQVASLHQEILDLISLTKDLQTLAYADNQQIEPLLTWNSVTSFCHSLGEKFKLLFEAKQLELIIECGHKRDQQRFDINLLQRALFKVLENSMKYSAPGKVWLKTTENAQHLCFSIEDQGPGLAVNDLPKIFEAFYRTESSRSREFGGSGLGLSIFKSVFRLHQGEARAELNAFGGLKVSGFLPVTQSKILAKDLGT